jgi:hypothetical protein
MTSLSGMLIGFLLCYSIKKSMLLMIAELQLLSQSYGWH